METHEQELAALREELAGQRLCHERLVSYMDKLLKEYHTLERELELCRLDQDGPGPTAFR